MLTLMLALSLLGYLVAELFRGYVADSSPYVPGLSYSQFSMLMISSAVSMLSRMVFGCHGDYPGRGYFR